MSKKFLYSVLIIITIIIITSLIFLFQCYKTSDIEINKITINEDLSFEINNNSIKIFLEGNITTGYSWSYKITNNLLTLPEESYEPIDNSNTRVGSGGTFIFNFTTNNPGIEKMIFEYSRSWDENSKIKEYVLDLKINEDLSIEVLN